MVENYTKDLKKSFYHGAVISILTIGSQGEGGNLYS